MVNLKELSDEDLKKLLDDVQAELKIRNSKKEFEFEFYCRGTIKRKPYVAKLYLKYNTVQRDFYKMQERWEDYEYIVEGKYKAKIGDVIEKRVGDNGKEDFIYWSVITEDGEEEFQILNMESAEEWKKNIGTITNRDSI